MFDHEPVVFGAKTSASATLIACDIDAPWLPSLSKIETSCDPKEAKACKLTTLRFAVLSFTLIGTVSPSWLAVTAVAALTTQAEPLEEPLKVTKPLRLLLSGTVKPNPALPMPTSLRKLALMLAAVSLMLSVICEAMLDNGEAFATILVMLSAYHLSRDIQ